MARVSIEIGAPPDLVWGVLADAEAYGDWVVGTKHVVRADAGWPEPGSALEYELGVGPVTVRDRTIVVESEPPRLLVLRAELRRLGTAAIRIELEPVGRMTRVVLDELPVEGVLDAAHNGLSDAALEQRNGMALDRLRRLAEERA